MSSCHAEEASKRQRTDNVNKTADICARLHVTTPLFCTNEVELAAALRRAPDCSIPIAQYGELSRSDDVPPDILSSFCPHVDGEWNKVSNVVSQFLDAARHVEGASEMDAGRLHAQFMVELFRLFAGLQPVDMSFTFHRNQAEPSAASTTERLRPDTSGRTHWGVLVFKGEEKADTDTNSLMRCRAELLEKMASWEPIHMGMIPFVLCYGAAGSFVRFYCVRPTATSVHTIHDVSDTLDVNTPRDRLRLAMISINCFRVMVAMASAAPAPGAHGLDQELLRPSGLRLKFAGDYVEKIYSLQSLKHVTTGANCVAFKDLLTILQTNRPAHLEHPAASGMEFLHGKEPINVNRQSTVQVCMVPCGFSVRPATPPELQYAILCVLLGLQALHTLGWVHGDVRWPNIVRIAADNWCLIDLDHARKLALDVAVRKVNDLHAVGRLFDAESSPLAASPDAVALRQVLIEANDETNIETLLTHAWFHGAAAV